MKKTIVALAVAAVAATSANAATVYNQDGSKVEVNGSVRVLLEKAKDKRTDLKDNGSRIVFKGKQDLGNGLSALAYSELRFSSKTGFGDKVQLKRLYAGFGYEGVGTLTFGKQLTIGDKIGYSDYSYLYGGVGKPLPDGERVINFTSASFNGFSFGAAYVFEDDTAKTAERTGRGAVVAGLYERKIGDVGFKVGAGYSEQQKSKVVNKSEKEKIFKVGGEVSYTAFAAGVDYLQSKKSGTQEKKRGIELGLQYKVNDMVKVYTVLSHVKENKTNTQYYKTRALTLGAGYKLHKQVETFVEGGWNKTKNENAKVVNRDRNVGVGLRVHF
ncbi:porin [Pasteurella sp. PK-2025]|uniref:porin n=1 Tax=unclassified Pasteurella TaxID=2621516 RepID=UPI003C72E9A9